MPTVNCPQCNRELTHHLGAKVPVTPLAPRYRTTEEKMYKFQCRGTKGCGHAFLIIRSRSLLKPEAKPTMAVSYDWKAWESAVKHPQKDQGGHMVGQYTNFVNDDPATKVITKAGRVVNLLMARYYPHQEAMA